MAEAKETIISNRVVLTLLKFINCRKFGHYAEYSRGLPITRDSHQIGSSPLLNKVLVMQVLKHAVFNLKQVMITLLISTSIRWSFHIRKIIQQLEEIIKLIKKPHITKIANQ